MQIYEKNKTDGAIVLDGKWVADTLQCVHCGSHEEIIPGSGKKRAFCPKHPENPGGLGFVCGRPACMHVCIPIDAQLDYVEAKQREDSKKTVKELLKKYPQIEQFTKEIGL